MILYALWFGSGAVFGGVSLESIRRTVARLDPADGAAAAAWVGLGRIARWAGAALLLIAALRTGWTYGLAAAAGHWLAVRLLLARENGRV
jgi:hypothetical protein